MAEAPSIIDYTLMDQCLLCLLNPFLKKDGPGIFVLPPLTESAGNSEVTAPDLLYKHLLSFSSNNMQHQALGPRGTGIALQLFFSFTKHIKGVAPPVPLGYDNP